MGDDILLKLLYHCSGQKFVFQYFLYILHRTYNLLDLRERRHNNRS